MLLCGSLLLVLAAGELVLRWMFPVPEGYFIWPPGLRAVFRPTEGVMPGVRGEARLAINAHGFRGDELLPSHTYRILALGGSTTECLYLDQEETWPHALQEELNARQSLESVWVGNAGMSGRTTLHHRMALRHLPLQQLEIDAVVLLAGINDLARRLSRDGDPVDPDARAGPEPERSLMERTFMGGFPGQRRGLLDATAIGRLLKDVLSRERGAQDETGRIYSRWRRHRQSASEILEQLPDVSAALAAYRESLNAIVDLAEERSVRLILLTQPTVWRADLPREIEELLWLGGIGDFQNEPGKPYYSAGALARGMEAYNRTLLEVCRERGLECLDLASMLPKDTSVFYDDVHFNEEGAETVARLLADYLLASDPFAGL